MKKILSIVLVGLLLVGCGTKEPESEYTRYTNQTLTAGFDTVMTLLAYTKTKDDFDDYFDMMRNEFIHYNELFDRYNSYTGVNNIKTINDNAGIAAVEVDQEIISMLLLARTYSEISSYFDITLGAMLEIWHDYREAGELKNAEGLEGEIPSLEILEEAMAFTGWDKVEIDETNHTVFLTEKGMSLDVGAIAKGYATEKVALKLEAEGLEFGIVSGGGNIRTINTRADGASWAIGIQEPSVLSTAENIDVISIPHSVSVVTSGDYQRTFTGPNGESFSHLINPKTLFPATNFRSVSVIMKDSGAADALSTALFMMTYEEGQDFAQRYNQDHPDDQIGVFWIVDDNPDWYQQGDYSFNMTDNLKEYSRNLNQAD